MSSEDPAGPRPEVDNALEEATRAAAAEAGGGSEIVARAAVLAFLRAVARDQRFLADERDAAEVLADLVEASGAESGGNAA